MTWRRVIGSRHTRTCGGSGTRRNANFREDRSFERRDRGIREAPTRSGPDEAIWQARRSRGSCRLPFLLRRILHYSSRTGCRWRNGSTVIILEVGLNLGRCSVALLILQPKDRQRRQHWHRETIDESCLRGHSSYRRDRNWPGTAQ